MNRLYRSLSCLAFAVSAVAGLSAANQDLVGNSPFVPANFNQKDNAPTKTGGPLDKLELRGVTSLNGVKSFFLVDTGNKKDYWIDLHATVEGYRVVSYDPNAQSVVVEANGASRSLKLKEAKIVALAPPTPGKSGQQSPSQTHRSNGNGSVNQLSDQEIRARMQRVAEEIRRRRAMRRAALERERNQNNQQNRNGAR